MRQDRVPVHMMIVAFYVTVMDQDVLRRAHVPTDTQPHPPVLSLWRETPLFA